MFEEWGYGCPAGIIHHPNSSSAMSLSNSKLQQGCDSALVVPRSLKVLPIAANHGVEVLEETSGGCQGSLLVPSHSEQWFNSEPGQGGFTVV